MSGKRCVFCGQTPERKTREHILPQWLLAHTGDPARVVDLGIRWGADVVKPIRFSFSSFTLPACANCNNKFSKLENRASVLLTKAVPESVLQEQDCVTLLDWFDKVRVSLWLATLHLSGNPIEIKPRFHVEERLGCHDRMLAIYSLPRGSKGLSPVGVSTIAFHHMPSVFGLVINDRAYISLSTQYALSREMGFPYPAKMGLLGPGLIYAELVHGTGKAVVPELTRLNGMPDVLCQTMFRASLVSASSLYDDQYVIENSIDHSAGVGGVFHCASNCISRVGGAKITAITLDDARWSFPIEVLSLQNKVTAMVPPFVSKDGVVLNGSDLRPENSSKFE